MRQTDLGLRLANIFDKNTKPLTVIEILNVLRLDGLRPNKTTVYRQIERMVEKKDVEHIHLEKRGLGYEKVRKHHHHLICNNCGKVDDLMIKDEDKILGKLFSRNGFKPQEHHLEIFGLCASCQSI